MVTMAAEGVDLFIPKVYDRGRVLLQVLPAEVPVHIR